MSHPFLFAALVAVVRDPKQYQTEEGLSNRPVSLLHIGRLAQHLRPPRNSPTSPFLPTGTIASPLWLCTSLEAIHFIFKNIYRTITTDI